MNEGTYPCVIVRNKFTTSNSGTPGLELEVDVDDGFGQKESIIGTIWLSDKAMRMARKQLKAIGFDPDKHDLTSLKRDSLEGVKTTITLAFETYKGKTNLKVKNFGDMGGTEPTKEQLLKAQEGLRKAGKKAKEEDNAPLPDEEQDETQGVVEHEAETVVERDPTKENGIDENSEIPF